MGYRSTGVVQANGLRISRCRGARHRKASKKPRSRAPKAVGLQGLRIMNRPEV
jgi:hypothetical protein